MRQQTLVYLRNEGKPFRLFLINKLKYHVCTNGAKLMFRGIKRFYTQRLTKFNKASETALWTYLLSNIKVKFQPNEKGMLFKCLNVKFHYLS